MRINEILKYKVVLERWSILVPIICYSFLLCLIWTLSVPLKSRQNTNLPNKANLFKKQKLEESFEVKIKNSNFNSDKVDAENQLLNMKNEYLVRLNQGRGGQENPASVLEEVFKK